MKSRYGRLGVIVCVLSMLVPTEGQRVAAQQQVSPSPHINVRDYGATGLGTSSNDDTTAINNAISACPQTGCTVFFPPGKYYISSTIKILATTQSIELRGAGGTSYNQATASQIVSDQPGFYLVTAYGPQPYGPSIVNLGFRDISSGHNQVTGGIDLQGVSFFHLDYVSCSDIKGTSPSSTATGICIQLDGIGSPTPGYTQWGTILARRTSSTACRQFTKPARL